MFLLFLRFFKASNSLLTTEAESILFVVIILVFGFGFFTLGNMVCDTIVVLCSLFFVLVLVVLPSRAQKHAQSIAQNICVSLQSTHLSLHPKKIRRFFT
jgi:hypothetical protein